MFNFKTIDLQKLPLNKIIILGLLASLIFTIRSCNLKDLEISQTGLQIQMYEKQNQTFSKTINKLGQEVSTQKEMVLIRDKALEKELLRNSNLQSLNQQVSLDRSIGVSNVEAKFDSMPKLNDSTKVVPVGSRFNKTNIWYTIRGSIKDSGIFFDRIRFNDTLIINFGKKRQPGLLGYIKPKESVIEVINFNPYVNTTGMKNITLKDQKNWYQTDLAKVLFGFALGFTLTKL